MKELNEEEKKVILNKGTEAPFSGVGGKIKCNHRKIK